jgi:peptidoglycan hydrolase-like protein with peptidoglycan-binding domain
MIGAQRTIIAASETYMRRILAILAAVAVPHLVSSSGTAQAPRVAPAPPSVDSAFDAQKAAFLALPLATRKVAQDALVWLGFYNGSNDGEFGKRTRDSISVWQRSQKQAADGVLSQGQIQALLAAVEKARAAVGFETVDDAKTGARIGAPRKLMAPDGAKLDFVASADVDLAALYARLSVDTPTRKVAYKTMKPNGFFVVTGQDGEAKFYTRYERNENFSPQIRGFTFSYPAARAAQFDRIAIAVANSFEAFPTRGEGAATAPAPEAATSKPNPPPGPIATAFVVGPGQALTALKPDDCANPMVDGKPARFERTDAKTGLAILSGDFAPEGKPPGLGSLAPDPIALSYGGARLAANSASLRGAPGRPFVLASLEKSASGAPLFDRRGGLVGIIAPIGQDPKRAADVALAAPYPIVEPQAVGAFLGSGELEPVSEPLSAGALVEREKGAVVPVSCRN